MHIEVRSGPFKAGLTVAGKASAQRSSLKVLQNVKLAAGENGGLRITGTNLEVGVSVVVPALVYEDGAYTVPNRMLGEVLSKLDVDGFVLKLDGKLERLSVTNIIAPGNAKAKAGGAGSWRLNGIPADEFPSFPLGERPDFELPVVVIKEILDRVMSCAGDARDGSRPALTGVCFEFKGDAMRATATDGHRLAKLEYRLAGINLEPLSVIVPVPALKLLGELLAYAGDTIGMTNTDTHVCFHGEGDGDVLEFTLVTQRIEAIFPDVMAHIPTGEPNYSFTVNLPAFRRAVHVATLFARDDGNYCEIQALPDMVRVSAMALTGDTYGTVDATMTGQAFPVGFSVRFLADAMRWLPDQESVTPAIYEDGNVSKMVFREPAQAEGQRGLYTHVIAAMSLREKAGTFLARLPEPKPAGAAVPEAAAQEN